MYSVTHKSRKKNSNSRARLWRGPYANYNITTALEKKESKNKSLLKNAIFKWHHCLETEFANKHFDGKGLCIGQTKASTCPPPGNPPGIWLFGKLLFKFPPTRAKMPLKCPTLGSIQVIKCPHPRDISQAHKWQKDGGNAFSCGTKSL